MNTFGILFTITVFVTVHVFIMKMFKNAVNPKQQPTVKRSKMLGCNKVK